METQTCTRCNETYPATTEYFYRNPRKVGVLRTRCKWCSDLARASYIAREKKKKHAADYQVGGVMCRAFSTTDKGTYTEHTSLTGGRVIEFNKKRKTDDRRKSASMVGYASALAYDQGALL